MDFSGSSPYMHAVPRLFKQWAWSRHFASSHDDWRLACESSSCSRMMAWSGPIQIPSGRRWRGEQVTPPNVRSSRPDGSWSTFSRMASIMIFSFRGCTPAHPAHRPFATRRRFDSRLTPQALQKAVLVSVEVPRHSLHWWCCFACTQSSRGEAPAARHCVQRLRRRSWMQMPLPPVPFR